VIGRLPALRAPVLQVLGLVEHGEREGAGAQLLGVAAQHSIGSQQHVARPERAWQPPLRAVMDDRP